MNLCRLARSSSNLRLPLIILEVCATPNYLLSYHSGYCVFKASDIRLTAADEISELYINCCTDESGRSSWVTLKTHLHNDTGFWGKILYGYGILQLVQLLKSYRSKYSYFNATGCLVQLLNSYCGVFGTARLNLVPPSIFILIRTTNGHAGANFIRALFVSGKLIPEWKNKTSLTDLCDVVLPSRNFDPILHVTRTSKSTNQSLDQTN